MRVLLVTDSFPPRCGGSGHSVAALARGLHDEGVDVAVVHRVVGPRVASHLSTLDGIPVRRVAQPELGVPVLRDLHRALIRDRAFEAALVAGFVDWRPDIVHAQQGSNFAAVAHAARSAGIAAVATVRDYAPMCLRTTRFRRGAPCDGCSAIRLADCFADRYGVAGWALVPLVPAGLWATRRRTRALDRFARVIAVSSYVAGVLRDAGVRAPIDVLLNLPPALRAPLARPPAAPAGPYVLFAGKLNREKGADLLPALALALPPDARLVVLGDGPYAAPIDDASGRGAPLARYTDVANEEVLAWLAHAECLVLPSRWQEPLSRLLLEASAVGTPVVAFATGGTAEVIETEQNGLLATSDRALLDAVVRVLGDARLRAHLAAGMHARARRELSRAPLVSQVLGSYERALEGPRSQR